MDYKTEDVKIESLKKGDYAEETLNWKVFLGDKVKVRKLPVYTPPLQNPITDGGRILTPAGEIAQVINGINIKFIAYVEFEFPSDVRRGNHYHKDHEEYLYIIRGKLHATYENVMTKEQEELELEAGDLVRVESGCAHVYLPLEYSQSLEITTQSYNPSDTHKYVIN